MGKIVIDEQKHTEEIKEIEKIKEEIRELKSNHCWKVKSGGGWIGDRMQSWTALYQCIHLKFIGGCTCTKDISRRKCSELIEYEYIISKKRIFSKNNKIHKIVKKCQYYRPKTYDIHVNGTITKYLNELRDILIDKYQIDWWENPTL